MRFSLCDGEVSIKLIEQRLGKDMIKENQIYLNRIQIALDLVLVAVSMLLAYVVRFQWLDGQTSLPVDRIFRVTVFMVLVFGVLYSLVGLYRPKRRGLPIQEVMDIIKANLAGIGILMMGLYFFKMEDFSRLMLGVFFGSNLLFTISERMFIRFTLRHYRQMGFNQKHCLLIGANEIGDDFIEKIEKNRHWGYQIRGVLDNWAHKGGTYHGYPVLGGIGNLVEVLLNQYFDLVVVALTSEDAEELGYILAQCEKAGVKSNVIPYYYRYIPTRPYMDDLDGLPIIDTRQVPLDNWFKGGVKRCFDICFALAAILLTSPVMLLSVIMVKLTSPGPVIFKQERVGRNRSHFMMYKFRSMRVQTDEEEHVQWTVKNDPRKTRWGAFMRKTSIDELPQFFNVLKGDMSVVGPRPERPYFVDKFKEEIPRYMIKHQVRPGITGWAQVHGYRGDTSIEERINHDLYYIENWTLAMDIQIIFLTVFKGLVNKNAY